ncbi:response regulator [Paenibacillus psychroresistens]|uniref:Response regulator n=1 Tax=Paenibacillus psychroresistens TaxID=1778678 RepID=A0A6B8RDY6_9BACL|nr:response regulator [Paenibacillus psychroresistens]QGQ94380.1 response regulator [Paenibacillus psychroresistens]
MYNILLVDDEPFICKGLNHLLASSGLDIQTVFIANSGLEAMDYLRMEDIDLLITDIHIGDMNGIDLMHQAMMIKPWIQMIVVSAHETFQYAQLSIRLGAKDYLIKPINSGQFLDSVRNVLLKMDKQMPANDKLKSNVQENFRMDEPLPERTELLNQFIANPTDSNSLNKLAELHDIRLVGPYYSMISIRLNLKQKVKSNKISANDVVLLHYAALNIVNELLDKEWDNVAFYSSEEEISILIQWEDAKYEDTSINKINQLDMIGRSLQFNIHSYLNLVCVVGISQILKGIEYLGLLNEQCHKAVDRNQAHPDHFVFYYGDFNREIDSLDPTEDELSSRNNSIVEKAKQYIDQNYAQKGLTLHEVAHKNHVSPNYLSYLFKKITGLNLWEYVIRLRMEESKRLILSTDLRRYEISEKVGYESPEHFSKIFKKYYGISPSEVKK